jgi:hypothetical protein
MTSGPWYPSLRPELADSLLAQAKRKCLARTVSVSETRFEFKTRSGSTQGGYPSMGWAMTWADSGCAEQEIQALIQATPDSCADGGTEAIRRQFLRYLGNELMFAMVEALKI